MGNSCAVCKDGDHSVMRLLNDYEDVEDGVNNTNSVDIALDLDQVEGLQGSNENIIEDGVDNGESEIGHGHNLNTIKDADPVNDDDG